MQGWSLSFPRACRQVERPKLKRTVRYVWTSTLPLPNICPYISGEYFVTLRQSIAQALAEGLNKDITMIKDLIPASSTAWVAVPIVAVLAYFFLPLVISRYPNAPGPAWAKFTSLWQGVKYAEGNFHNINVDLHRKHGMPLIADAPQSEHFACPSAG